MSVSRLKIINSLLVMTIACVLMSCGYLIQPKVKQGMANLQKGSYLNDPQHTSVIFKVGHMGLSTFVGRFNKVEASLEFDPKNLQNAQLSAIINVASVDVNNASLEDSLRGSSWFDTDKYPQAFFKTTSVTLVDEKRARFNGNLTLHGVTAPIVLDVVFNGGANDMLTGHYTVGFSATTSIRRSVFGVDYLIPAIADTVEIEVYTEFQRQ